jgi:hypothetical protein
MIFAIVLDQLDNTQLRSLAAHLLQNVARIDKELLHHKTRKRCYRTGLNGPCPPQVLCNP